MVNGRSAAWKIKPGSYFLLPFKEAFGQDFPRDSCTVFLTLRPSKESEVRDIGIQFMCFLNLEPITKQRCDVTRTKI